MAKDMTKGVRRNARNIKLSNPGDRFKGTYQGEKSIEMPDRSTGELLPKKLYFFKDSEGQPAQILASAGLRMAVESANLEVGETIEIVRLENEALEGGRSLSVYDILSV